MTSASACKVWGVASVRRVPICRKDKAVPRHPSILLKCCHDETAPEVTWNRCMCEQVKGSRHTVVSNRHPANGRRCDKSALRSDHKLSFSAQSETCGACRRQSQNPVPGNRPLLRLHSRRRHGRTDAPFSKLRCSGTNGRSASPSGLGILDPVSVECPRRHVSTLLCQNGGRRARPTLEDQLISTRRNRPGRVLTARRLG